MRTITNKLGLSSVWVDAVIQDFLDYDKCGDISVTGAINPPQVQVLTERHEDDLVEDVTDRLNVFLGNAVHAQLERVSDETALSEERVVYDFNGVKVSLKPDRVEPIADTNPTEFCVKDFKVVSIWKVIHNELDEYEQQGNIYAYIFRKIGINATKIVFELLLKDWKHADSLRDKSYPQVHVKVIPFRVWSDEECEKFLDQRIKIHMAARLLPDEALPKCTGEERWLRDERFCVMKKGAKKSSRNKPTKAEAQEWMDERGYSEPLYSIVYKSGENVRCERFCPAQPFCHQYATEINPEF